MACKMPSSDSDEIYIKLESLGSELTGINFNNKLESKPDLNIIEYLYYYNGGGVGILDVNNDGLDDIFFSGNEVGDELYLNEGDMKFKNITQSAGINSENNWSTGVAIADVNNDGLVDIYVSTVSDYKNLEGHNRLYINNGDLTFTETSKETGLDFVGFGTQASFFDYDNDGDLDVYLLNHSIHTPRNYGRANKRFEKDLKSGDRMYENLLNEGNFKFVEVTEKSGIYSSSLGYGLAISTIDVNQDGYTDIYVGNDFHENDYLYLNNGDKTFSEVSKEKISHTSRFTMGVDISDINGDLIQDIFTLDMMPFKSDIFMKSGGEDSDKVSQIKKDYGYNEQLARNHMQLGTNEGIFKEVALITNTYATDWSWSSLVADFDNDGQKDIYITNGLLRDIRNTDADKKIADIVSKKINEYIIQNPNNTEITLWDVVDLKELLDLLPSQKLKNYYYKNHGNQQIESFLEMIIFLVTYLHYHR